MVGTLVCVDLASFENALYNNPGQQILTGVTEFFRTVDTVPDLHYMGSDEEGLAPLTRQSLLGVFLFPKRRCEGFDASSTAGADDREKDDGHHRNPHESGGGALVLAADSPG
jgi:hypothetical protein